MNKTMKSFRSHQAKHLFDGSRSSRNITGSQRNATSNHRNVTSNQRKTTSSQCKAISNQRNPTAENSPQLFLMKIRKPGETFIEPRIKPETLNGTWGRDHMLHSQTFVERTEPNMSQTSKEWKKKATASNLFKGFKK
ncbi:hypothetical protein CC78DRAFT_544575 [Lojkania enalia]|uniref:Uncharacterized protein n=1 Tax=Lojkania enalia TaxID=147567 RepID=A0A9P4K8V3_9PLEO|nr:hypothetical protein CC78DRAFT_544575 [Didymosphaeria enalia]